MFKLCLGYFEFHFVLIWVYFGFTYAGPCIRKYKNSPLQSSVRRTPIKMPLGNWDGLKISFANWFVFVSCFWLHFLRIIVITKIRTVFPFVNASTIYNWKREKEKYFDKAIRLIAMFKHILELTYSCSDDICLTLHLKFDTILNNEAYTRANHSLCQTFSRV